MRERPIIGVTGPDAGGAAAWYFTRFAIWLAGGHAVRITPQRPRRIEGLDGLIIGGGADVDPALYGQQPHQILPRARPADEPRLVYAITWLLAPLTWLARKLSGKAGSTGRDLPRDRLELSLLEEAIRRRLPVIGICRGAQLINVHFRGTLHQSLAGFYVEEPEIRSFLPRKRVLIEPGSKLEQLIGRRSRRVNALHRQAIDQLGRGLRVAARDLNHIVQAIEHATLPLMLGVQWHPEYLPQLGEQRALFEALVQEALHSGRMRESESIASAA